MRIEKQREKMRKHRLTRQDELLLVAAKYHPLAVVQQRVQTAGCELEPPGATRLAISFSRQGCHIEREAAPSREHLTRNA